MRDASEAVDMHVAFSCDANYAMPLAAAICSVASHCDRSRRLSFHVFQSGIGDAVRVSVENSLRRTGFPHAVIVWHEAPIDRVNHLRLNNSWLSAAALVRLLISDLLPVDVSKVIYLDCDLVVVDDLGALWDEELQGLSLLAVRDTIGYVGNADGGLPNYRELGIPAEAPYFNSGVLVINVDKWRREHIPARLINYYELHQSIITYEDQEVLNAALFDDWRELDFRWNWQIVWRGVRIGTHRPGWQPNRSQKSIVHFITGEKPWLPGCDYPERDLYYRYLDKTVWSGWRVPWHREMVTRALRPFSDARNSLGRLRRSLVAP